MQMNFYILLCAESKTGINGQTDSVHNDISMHSEFKQVNG